MANPQDIMNIINQALDAAKQGAGYDDTQYTAPDGTSGRNQRVPPRPQAPVGQGPRNTMVPPTPMQMSGGGSAKAAPERSLSKVKPYSKNGRGPVRGKGGRLGEPTTEQELSDVSDAMSPEPNEQAVQRALDSDDPLSNPLVNKIIDSWETKRGQKPSAIDDMVRNTVPTDSVVELYDEVFNGGKINQMQRQPSGPMGGPR